MQLVLRVGTQHDVNIGVFRIHDAVEGVKKRRQQHLEPRERKVNCDTVLEHCLVASFIFVVEAFRRFSDLLLCLLGDALFRAAAGQDIGDGRRGDAAYVRDVFECCHSGKHPLCCFCCAGEPLLLNIILNSR